MSIDRETLMKFKTIFEEQKRNLLYTHEVINENFHISQDDFFDEVDLTSSELETSMRMRLRNREALYLKKIEESLRRIADGTFGECQGCGDEIELKRLEARPTTALCVDCKEEEERREHVHIDGRAPKSLGSKLRLA